MSLNLHRSHLTVPVVFSHIFNNNILINLINNALKLEIISKNIYFIGPARLSRHHAPQLAHLRLHHH